MRRQLVHLVLSVVVLAATAACSSESDGAEPTTTAAPSTIAATTTTEMGTTTTMTPTTIEPTTTVPPPAETIAPGVDEASVLSSYDWPAVIQILSRRRDALYESPVADPTRFTEICADADGSCLLGLSTQVPDLVTKGYRIVGADSTVVLPTDVVVENIEQEATIETALIGQNGRSRTTLVRAGVGAEWRILNQSDAGNVPQ
jgi:hypothetical protein